MLVVFALALGLAGAPQVAAGAPVVGEGRAEAGPAQGGAWREAVRGARRAALAEALSGFGARVDPALRDRILDRELDSWTSAYRVLEQHHEPDAVRVRVQVEIDLGRLAKRVLPSRAGPRSRTLGSVVGEGTCAAAGPEVHALRQALLDGAGLVEGGEAGEVRAELSCEDLGHVPLAGVEVARVRLVVRTPFGSFQAAKVAAGGDRGAARVAAASRAAVALAPRLRSDARADAAVRVVGPAPARFVRHLVRALGRSVPGVGEARLQAVAPGGAPEIGLRTDLAPDELAARLAALQFPDFAVRIERSDGALVVIRLE